MKHVFTLLLISFVIASQAQVQMGFDYVNSTPQGTLGQNIQPVHSFAMGGNFRLKANPQFYLGAELALGSYAHKTQEQTLISPEDGFETHTDVHFSSNIHNYHAVLGYDLTKGTMVIPYVTVKTGVSRFNTNISIADPTDEDSCHPLEEESVFNDVAFSAGAGAGLKIDASTIFRRPCKGSWWFDFSANYLWGSSLDYINVKYLSPDEPGPNNFTREVGAEFVHITSHHTHEHQIAQVYTSNIRLLDFKIGIVKTLGWCK
jgi:opacity protein-like surface antigen